MSPWEEKRLLILGMTYPSYSRKYTENVCTGALDGASGGMVRIHPISARDLDSNQRFKPFQWIRASVRKHEHDPRPESLRIQSSSIVLEELVPSRRGADRVALLNKSPHLVRSVEELRRRHEFNKTSLGALRPKEITRIYLKRRTRDEEQEWLQKEKALLSQRTLGEEFLRPAKPIDFPVFRFMVRWICDDPGCPQEHNMGLEEWGLHELSRRLRLQGDPSHDEKVLQAMKQRLDLETRDVIFFLGSFRTKMWNFGLMGACSVKRTVKKVGSENPARQLGLF